MLQRTAKSCCPDAPTRASSSRMANRPYRAQMSHTSADDGGKRARSPRARGKPLKPLRAGMPGDSGVLVYSCAFFINAKRARGCGCNGHPAFPTPSVFKGETTATPRALSVARAKSHLELRG